MKYILPPLFSISVLILLLFKVNVVKVLNTIKIADPLLLIIALLISSFVNIFVAADKYKRILGSMNCPISLKESSFIVCGSGPLRLMFPFKSGEVIKAIYLSKHRNLPIGRGISSILFDKVLNLMGTCFFLFLGIFLIDVNLPKEIIFLMITLPILFFLFPQIRNLALIFLKRIHVKLFRFLEELISTFGEIKFKSRIYLLIYAIFFQSSELINAYLIFTAYGVKISLFHIIAFIPIIVLISNIPIAASGLGTREAAILFLFSKFARADKLLSVGITLSFIEYIFPALIGIFIMKRFLSVTLGAGSQKSI